MQRLIQARPASTVNDSRHTLTYSDFTETALHAEVSYVYANARADLKAYYDLGRYMQDGCEENWVIRWAIYKSFRNSVNRGRSRTTAPSNLGQSRTTPSQSQSQMSNSSSNTGSSATGSSSTSSQTPGENIYESRVHSPLAGRNSTRLHQRSNSPVDSVTDVASKDANIPNRRSEYWDPARDT